MKFEEIEVGEAFDILCEFENVEWFLRIHENDNYVAVDNFGVPYSIGDFKKSWNYRKLTLEAFVDPSKKGENK